ncbi:ATP-grasp domain-containing protein [Kitasatospora sp. LaBMicrA B282]|uniref:ATP-grasp domain-containing protein n=1 Tax=Kitasatospora sp. LaBMicrA B282 TaxID=3420949 RepID=UPI003D0CD602
MSATQHPRPHVIVVNRWQEQYARYAEYLDHATHRVSYLSTEIGLASVPAQAHDVRVVRATDDPAEVRPALQELIARHGRPQAIVALKEDDLLIAAQLREEWEVPGPRVADLTRFRDKYLMASAVAAAGLEIPNFALVTDAASVLEFGQAHGWPVVVKPILGSSSDGVVKVDGPAEVAALDLADRPMMVQRFQPGQIYHVDGVFTGTELLVCRGSRYLNTCLGFRSGDALGSVEEDDPAINAAIAESARAYLGALTDAPLVFHLELFVDTAAGPPRCSFLEVGARVGGAEIPFLWREVHGYDLMDAAFQLQLGRPVPTVPERTGGELAGFLLVPAPAARPCRIVEVTPMTGRPDGPYAEALLPVGGVLPRADAYYEHVGGRFRFRGARSGDVERAVAATAAAFRVAAVPLEGDETDQADQAQPQLLSAGRA